MLTKPTVEELLPKAENRYVLSMLTAKRARQLTDGAKKMIDSKTENYVSLASEEINENKVKAVRGKLDVTIPLRPEVEAERQTAELEAEAKRRDDRQRYESNLRAERQKRQNNQVPDLVAEALLEVVSQEDSSDD
ncbi:MAG: DNA-directed RNA polymerase subunit omega [Clostridiaceae bacterium]|nr:DNA-directed RNA polymerase subunit omega [Clostridiaceae bacterium]